MSIIIQIKTASFIPSSVRLPSAPSIIKAKTKLAMVPGIDQSDRTVMTDDENSMVDIATSNTLYTHTVNDLKSNHVLGSCFGLPYQDHNYGAPPPPTPPSYSPCASPAHANGVPDEDTNLSVVSTTTANEETQAVSITRCICGFEHDDEYMICCDHCLVWQHVECMGLDRNNIPDTYLCEKCQPRKVDRHKAKVLQTRKKVAMTDSSETEDDIEVKNSDKKTRTRSKRRRREEERTEKSDHASGRRSRNLQKHKERFEAKRSKLRRAKNKESTGTADEEAQDAWEVSMDWCEKNFEIAITNQYTPEVQHLAKTLPLNGHERRFMELLLTRHCHVINDNQKKLISIYDIPREQPLIQYVGKFLLASQFNELHPAFSKRLFPYVMFYSLGQEDICIDSSVYGNEARFVRRSCKPNAELRHLVYNGNLHLYISSTKAVFKDDEITLPLDFNLKDSLKDIECACESEDCILKFHPRNGNVDISHEKRRRGRKLTLSADDDSSHSFLGSNPSPTKSKYGKSTQTSEHTDGKSENESEDQANERKKKTREERKIDAIMRAFDQMEKAAKRRQQALEKHKTHPQKFEESLEKIEIVVPIKEEEKVTTTVSSSETQGGEEEKVHIPTPKPKKGKRRRGSGSALSRRRTRTNSGGSDIVSPEENAQLKSEASTSAANIDISNAAMSTDTLNVSTTCSTTSTDTVGTTAVSSAPLSSPVLKTKRFLLHEWLQEKSEANTNAPSTSPLTVRSEVKWSAASTSTTYSQCTKFNPHSGGISAAHLRRSSTSGPIKSFPTKSCSEQGSAKKRWLRQAMYDCNSYDDPLSIDTSGIDGLQMENDCFSPNGHCEMGSPGTADDTITPLKKRRLMRESLDSTSCPLSPTVHNPEGTCPILSPVNEESKTENELEDIEQQMSMSVTASSCSDVSPSKSNEDTPNYNFKVECDENHSKLCNKEENSTPVLRTAPEYKPIIETLSTPETSSNSKGVEPSMQINCDPSMQKNYSSVQTDSIASSNNLDTSHNVSSTNCVLSSYFDKHSVQLCSDKNMQSNLQTHHNSTLVKVQNVLNESTTLNSSVKRKIVFPDEQCSTLRSSVSEDNTSSSRSDSSELKNAVSTFDGEIASSDTGVEHSQFKCENLPKENVNKILNDNSNISILPVNSESTKDNSSEPPSLYPEMPISISPVNDVNVSLDIKDEQINCIVKTPENCLTDVSIADSEVLCSNSFSSDHVNSNNEKSEKFSKLDFKFSHLSNENSGVAEKRTSASATQKRKVSLSEYRKRMKEGIPKRSSCETVKGSSATAIPGTVPDSLTLAPLPLFTTARSKSTPAPTPIKKPKKKKDPVKIEEPDDVIEHRENLTDRLKREFGFDEDSGDCTITSTINKFSSSVSSTLPVSAQPPPPPPPPPPPRPVRTQKSSKISGAAPTASTSQFGFSVPTRYTRPSYIGQQMPSAQFIPVQQTVPSPILPTMRPITPPVQPSLLPTPHSYSASLSRSILRPPMQQQREYSSVNAQSYAALVQQPPPPPPPPPKTYNHVYQPGLYK